jgi:monovalent cation:H+ antiporter, CPA1 family
MVLVLGLAADFPDHDLLVHMTFGVVLLSILVQGLTMNAVLKRLRVVTDVPACKEAYKRHMGRLRATAALEELKRLRETRAAHNIVLETLEAEYEHDIHDAEAHIRDLRLGQEQLLEEEERTARRRLLVVEKDELLQEVQAGTIRQVAFDALVSDIDEKLEALEEGLG